MKKWQSPFGADCITAKALSGNMRLNTEQESFVDMAEQIFEVPVKVHAWKKRVQ